MGPDFLGHGNGGMNLQLGERKWWKGLESGEKGSCHGFNRDACVPDFMLNLLL